MTNVLKAVQRLNRLNKSKLLGQPNRLLSSLGYDMSSRREMSSIGSQSTVGSADGLPKLIVPALDQTIERLKSSTKPFAKSSEELKDLYGLVAEFGRRDGVGAKLQSLLEHKCSQTTNWLSHDWWINKAYLEGRDPVMVWSNPGLVFPELKTLKKPNKEFVVQFISRLILSVIDFRNSLKNGVNPEMSAKSGSKAMPTVCMDQYTKMFGTCRKPGKPVDSIRFGSLESNDISIIISRLNRFYKLSLNQSHDKEVTLPLIQSAINHILSQTSSENISFGIFSTLPRNDFSTVFQLLDENAMNSMIESEFVVNIDHIEGSDDSFKDNESYYKLMGKQSLHGDIDNIGNRWFDKTIQLIVVTNKSGDQVMGSSICYEHTPAEGGTVVKLMEHSIKHLVSDKTMSQKLVPITGLQELSLVSKDNYAKVKASEEFSRQKYLDFINSIDLEVLEFKDYGKEFIKSVKCSPDSWIQLAIALAFYRLHGKVGATYESGGTRMYAFGRTETIRSVTQEFVQFFETPNFQTLMNAIESHKIVAKNAVNGHGIDRILLGYYCSAQEVKSGHWKWGLPQYVIDNPLNESDYRTLEALYSNGLYLRAKHFHMSTSQVSSIAAEAFMCYGPLVYDGYGCCYNPSKEQIIFAISSFKENNANTNAFAYKTQLINCLQYLQQIAVKHSKL